MFDALCVYIHASEGGCGILNQGRGEEGERDERRGLCARGSLSREFALESRPVPFSAGGGVEGCLDPGWWGHGAC